MKGFREYSYQENRGETSYGEKQDASGEGREKHENELLKAERSS